MKILSLLDYFKGGQVQCFNRFINIINQNNFLNILLHLIY